MRRFIAFIISISLAVCAMAQAPEQLGGTYYAYPGPLDTAALTPAPAGYTPIYISHYGRHGSRWMTNDKRYTDLLARFSSKKNLTRQGKAAHEMILKAWHNAEGNSGQLSPLGVTQHAGIASRMAASFPEVFGRICAVDAKSSTSPRCIASMNAFLDALQDAQPQINISTSSDAANMAFIAYQSPELKALEDRLNIDVDGSCVESLIGRLFKKPSKVHGHQKLFTELYYLASDMQDIPLDIKLLDIFTDEELRAAYEWSNQKMYALHGDTPLNEGLAEVNAVSLWQNIEKEADEALQNGSPNATLRFGHDSNLMRLLTLMDLQHGYGMSETVPMAANLQMIFYHKEGSPTLVKFLHNENETSLPQLGKGPYYEWNAVKEYMAGRISRAENIRRINTVNTFVGTDNSILKSAGRYGKGSEECGQTLPAVLVPNGQNFWTPQTRPTERKCVAPYYYSDPSLLGFRCSHWIVGGCTQDYGSFTISTISGEMREDLSTIYTHDWEVSHPHFYSVYLPQEGLTAEITATSHGSILRILPNADGPVQVVLSPNSDEGQGSVAIREDYVYAANPVHRIYQGKGLPAGFSGHIVMQHNGKASIKDTTVVISFDGIKGVPIEIRTATSFTSEEGALANLKAEISGKSFEEIALETEEKWVDRFHRIEVESADEQAVKDFYGALYRASFLPRELSDCDGSYPKFANGSTVKGKGRHFTDYSMWDTYRALHPLLALIEPELDGEMMQSLVDMYAEGGWMPIFPCWNSYTAAMIGDHCASAIADAYIKGIRNFDIEKAYEGLSQNAFHYPGEEEYKDGKGRRALKSYMQYGYIPLEDGVEDAYHKQEQSSRTLEYAYDDFAVAQLAKALGQEFDYEELMDRSEYWRFVFNEDGWVAGRYEDESFAPLLSISERVPFLTEGASCHYSWYVPQNVDGLIEVMGGPEVFCERLDSLFDGGYYWHGNEPCHQIAYLYNAIGKPEKTQQRVREILASEYADAPGGLAGNDDAGQMSAWYIFSSLGFYPVCPGTPEYYIGSPSFEKATFNLSNGKQFIINALGASSKNIYIQNSNPLKLTHQQILDGGSLDFEMGPSPAAK